MGSLFTATISWLFARKVGGQWWIRIDDIDPLRDDAAAKASFLPMLEQHGLHWDGVVYQSERYSLYQEHLQSLDAFPCACSRKQISERGGSHGPTCHSTGNNNAGQALRLAPCQTDEWHDLRLGSQSPQILDAPVLWRRDHHPSYHLACSVDEIEMGITQVVRGQDLLSSTSTHRSIIQKLGYEPPDYLHLPLVTHGTGQKLSKQNKAESLKMDQWSKQLSDVLIRLISEFEPEGDRPERWLEQALEHFNPQALTDLEDWAIG